MVNYDKAEVREKVTVDDIYELLTEWGGEPQLTDFGIISTTICHNLPGQGSRKLYYYSNSQLFQCFTEDGSFDLFDLVMKVMSVQHQITWDLNDCVRYVASRFGISGIKVIVEENILTEDWKCIQNYNRIQEISPQNYAVQLKDYDMTILKRFNYDVRIEPWLKEGISQEVLDYAMIGYFPGGEQITIPHFDINNRFIGLRGRSLGAEEAERYGKYRPIVANNLVYKHPLGMNLYGLNWAKSAIKTMGKAIVVESEKSVLKYMSYFGIENNIMVACCGSSLTSFQVQMLLDAGAQEIVIAFDRQFQEIGDKEFKALKTKLIKLHNKFNKSATISFMFDKEMITGYKDSPIDCGADKFLYLFKNRIIL